MSRPNKEGLDYFPLDCHMDDKIQLIEATHGIIGFGVAIKLFQEIYKNGYFLNATEERLLLFKVRVNVDIDKINAVINDGLRWGLFDPELFKKYNILTSRGIQKRYIEATKRRKSVVFIQEYIVDQEVLSNYPESVNVRINNVNVNKNKEKANINSQSKVKESIVKKRKESMAKTKKTVFTPPTLEETIQFFIENGFSEASAKKAHAYYQDNDWKDSRNNPVKNWKQKMRGVWFKDENLAGNDKHNNFKEKQYDGTPIDQISWMQD